MITWLRHNLMSIFKSWGRPNSLLPKFLLGLAVVGFLILWLMFTKRGNSLNHLTYTYKVYPTAIGFFLMIPYLIYLFASKSKPRKKLKENRNDTTNASDPSNNKATGTFQIFVLNESKNTLIINRNSELENNQWHIFQVKPNDAIFFSNGIVFTITDDNALEIEDFRNQIIGFSDDYYQKYDVPENVDWAFIITEPNNGDTAE